MSRNEKLPPGWAWDPFAEFEISDECDWCGAAIDDDTEVFFYGQWGHPGQASYIGCESCVISMSAREAVDKGFRNFDEYRTDTATGFPQKVKKDE